MRNFTVYLPCPYQSANGKKCKGETLSDGRAKVTISVVCNKCGHVYYADLDTAKTWPAKPQRRQIRH